MPLLRMLIEKSLHNLHCLAPRGVFGQASVVAIEAVGPSRDLSDSSHIAITEVVGPSAFASAEAPELIPVNIRPRRRRQADQLHGSRHRDQPRAPAYDTALRAAARSTLLTPMWLIGMPAAFSLSEISRSESPETRSRFIVSIAFCC